MQDAHSLQQFIFDEIQHRLDRKADRVEALSEILSLGKDAIYRRMRGDTVLTPDEITLLVRHFEISLDKFVFRNSNALIFTFSPFTQTVKRFEDYFSDIHADLSSLRNTSGTRIYYASSEIPIFHYLLFPELIAFKLYVWGRSIWNFDYLQDYPFDFDIIPRHVLQQMEVLLSGYRNIPSTELWSVSVMDNTLSQIEYHLNIGGFKKPADAIRLCDRLWEWTQHVERMAELGRKFSVGSKSESDGAEFLLFHNEMIYTNNTILVQKPNEKTVYTTHTNPNFLKTSDQRMGDYTENWFKNVLSKSTALSLHGEKGRKWYFDRLRRRIDLMRNRILSLEL